MLYLSLDIAISVLEGDMINKLRNNINDYFVGKESVVENVLICLLAGGHVLLEDVPGVGKTTLAKVLSQSVGADFGRIQFTPDTLPSDVTGMSIYNAKTGEFEYREGAVMHNFLLADEINRTSPKTQSSLLEAMAEGQTSVDGKVYKLPDLFMVIATQNPVEFLGTYPLPEAQLDRFMMKLSVGYPDREYAVKMADSFLEGTLHEETKAVLNASDIKAMQGSVKKVTVNDKLIEYAVMIVEATRSDEEISCGASPRALLALLRYAQAHALYEGRDYCTPSDILRSAALTLPHRLVLTAQARMNRMSQAQVLKRITDHIKVPS